MMKTDIHPTYDLVTVHCSCGNEFQTRSTSGDINVEICAECHPFYTGKQKLMDTGGRVERFRRRAAQAQAAAKASADKASPKKAPAAPIAAEPAPALTVVADEAPDGDSA
jgi:large subunit ribosomal protein L31